MYSDPQRLTLTPIPPIPKSTGRLLEYYDPAIELRHEIAIFLNKLKVLATHLYDSTDVSAPDADGAVVLPDRYHQDLAIPGLFYATLA